MSNRGRKRKFSENTEPVKWDSTDVDSDIELNNLLHGNPKAKVIKLNDGPRQLRIEQQEDAHAHEALEHGDHVHEALGQEEASLNIEEEAVFLEEADHPEEGFAVQEGQEAQNTEEEGVVLEEEDDLLEEGFAIQEQQSERSKDEAQNTEEEGVLEEEDDLLEAQSIADVDSLLEDDVHEEGPQSEGQSDVDMDSLVGSHVSEEQSDVDMDSLVGSAGEQSDAEDAVDGDPFDVHKEEVHRHDDEDDDDLVSPLDLHPLDYEELFFGEADDNDDDDGDDEPEDTDNEFVEVDDYDSILKHLSREWLKIERNHRVSKVAGNAFWCLARDWFHRLFVCKDRQNVRKKTPTFLQIRRTMYKQEVPPINMEFGYEHKETGVVSVARGEVTPKSQFPPNQYKKIWEVATVQVRILLSCTYVLIRFCVHAYMARVSRFKFKCEARNFFFKNSPVIKEKQ